MFASVSKDVSPSSCFPPFEDLNVKLEKAKQAAIVTRPNTLGPGYFCFLSFIVKDCLSYMSEAGNKN